MKARTRNKKACPEQSRRVYVAMSGGVDSSVSAALLKRAGFSVTGVFMKQWSPKVLSRVAGSRYAGGCIWKQERQDALRAANQLGIKFLTWDFSKEYEKQVGKYMISSYKKGITPNPDVMCNKVIKFGLFFDRAMKEGADFIATGHYAISSFSNFSHSATNFFPVEGSPSRPGGIDPNLQKVYCLALKKNSSLCLLKAKDKNKDQTYFLWTLKQKHLAKTLFPVGGLTKPEVRKLAKKFKLHNATKKDSQGVCFIGPLDMKNFLKSYIKPRKGKIFLIESAPMHLCIGAKKLAEVGTHDGVYYYTIGQRHGLDISDGKGPYFVVKKDIKKNIIYVGKEKDLYSKKAKIKNINWIEKPKKFPVLLDVRTRYRAPLAKAKLSKARILTFTKPEKAIAPGQSAVFYKGQKVLGGGVITE